MDILCACSYFLDQCSGNLCFIVLETVLSDAEQIKCFVCIFQGILDIVEVFLEWEIFEAYLVFAFTFCSVKIKGHMVCVYIIFIIFYLSSEWGHFVISCRNLIVVPQNIDLATFPSRAGLCDQLICRCFAEGRCFIWIFIQIILQFLVLRPVYEHPFYAHVSYLPLALFIVLVLWMLTSPFVFCFIQEIAYHFWALGLCL